MRSTEGPTARSGELYTSTHFLVKPRRGPRVSRGSQGSIHGTENLFCHMQGVRQGGPARVPTVHPGADYTQGRGYRALQGSPMWSSRTGSRSVMRRTADTGLNMEGSGTGQIR